MATKFTAAGSSSTGQNSILAGADADAAAEANTGSDERMEVKKQADDVDFDLLLEKERRKRREIEDAVDKMKDEISWQALAKSTYSLGRVKFSLQSEERRDERMETELNLYFPSEERADKFADFKALCNGEAYGRQAMQKGGGKDKC